MSSSLKPATPRTGRAGTASPAYLPIPCATYCGSRIPRSLDRDALRMTSDEQCWRRISAAPRAPANPGDCIPQESPARLAARDERHRDQGSETPLHIARAQTMRNITLTLTLPATVLHDMQASGMRRLSPADILFCLLLFGSSRSISTDEHEALVGRGVSLHWAGTLHAVRRASCLGSVCSNSS